MRSFPRAARQRFAVATMACALIAGAAAVPLAHAEDDLKKQQKQVEKQIESAHDDLEHSSRAVRRSAEKLSAARAALTSAKTELAGARQKVGEAKVRDTEMKIKLDAAVDKLEKARVELDAGRLATSEQRDAVVDTVTSLYQEGDPQLRALSSLLSAQTAGDLVRGIEARDAVVQREDRAYDDLRAAEVLLEVRETQVEAAKKDVAEQRRAAADHLVTMQGLRTEAQAARTRVQGLVASRVSAQTEANAARKRDELALSRLEKREDRIRKQILEAARKDKTKGFTGKSDGFFEAPTGGYVTSPFGYRKHPIYGYWGLHDGTDFGAACGSPLRAVASGTVMSKYYDSVYGNRLHLNVGKVNGKFLTAVYNHATSYTVGAGETVKRGQVIGYVGSTGWSTGCHLHFTTLVNGTASDPMAFL